MNKQEIIDGLESQLNGLADKFGEYVDYRLNDKTVNIDEPTEPPAEPDPEE